MDRLLHERVAATAYPVRPRARRWIVLVSMPLLLMAMLVAGMQESPVANAQTDVTVGNCTESQDFTTIQAAVNAAVADTIINICPGTYPESINLSLMNEIGDIVLRGFVDDGGDILINPPVGTGIWITPGEDFEGNIAILDLDITTNDFGIDFASRDSAVGFVPRGVLGDVDLGGIDVLGNSRTGANIRAFGGVTVQDSNFNQNLGHGIQIETVIDPDFFEFEAAEVGIPDIFIERVQANSNGVDGIHLNGSELIDILETEANGNGTSGGNGTNGGTGIRAFHQNPLYCEEGLAEFFPSINFVDVRTNDNLGGWGIYIYTNFDVFLETIEANNNPYDGVSVFSSAGPPATPCPPNFVELIASTAISNGFASAIRPLGEIGTQQTGFPFGGFRLLSLGDLFVGEQSRAELNYSFGYCLEGNGEADVQNSSATGNLGDGFTYGYNCNYNAGTSGLAQAAETGAQPAYELTGVAEAGETLVISDSSAIANQGAGFEVLDAHLVVTITSISALRNITGVAFVEPNFPEAGTFGINGVAAPEDDIAGPTFILDSRIQSNTAYGLFYGQELTDPIINNEVVGIQGMASLTSTNYVYSSIVCENQIAGLGAFQHEPEEVGTQQTGENHLLSVDARGNWWGSVTGPTHPDNPGGTGDRIVSEALNPTIAVNTVNVLFDPWIDTFLASASPNPALLGTTGTFDFQFSDAAQSFFLENGPGDRNGPEPFRLSVTNGQISEPLDRFIAQRHINGAATPAAAGVMAIQLAGPCGLSYTLDVPVANPAIAVTKSPLLQGIPPGENVIFTVTVYNTGNITLTDITVTDTLAPACGRSQGALGDLAPGASVSYPCGLQNVTSNLVNTVVAEGFALIGDGPGGDAVSDTATAQVVIASFTFTKTVFVDGFREKLPNGNFNPSECGLESSITVPAGTTVKYCYTVTNTGDFTFTTHSLVDNRFPNAILTDFPRELGPGQSFSTVDAGVEVTQTLSISTTNIATWTAVTAPPVEVIAPNAVNGTLPVVRTAVAEAIISAPGQDQDGDGRSDSDEGSIDTNSNGVPDFLDPAGPTNEPPVKQPDFLEEDLFLPSLGRR